MYIRVLTGSLRAYEKVWIIGDDFMSQSFTQYFQDSFCSEEGKTGYIRSHYDVTGFCNSRIKHMQGNVLNRLRTNLIIAINKQLILPKAIIVVMEKDVLIELDHFKSGISEGSGRIAEWLVNQFHRVVTGYKEKLPSKSRKFKFPTILWLLTSTTNVNSTCSNTDDNDSYLQECYKKWNDNIRKATALFREMEVLPLKNWDEDDQHYIYIEQ